MATTSGWLANLLGITTVQSDGVDVTARAKLNYVNMAVTSNADTDAIDVEVIDGATDTTNSDFAQLTTELETTNATETTAGATFALPTDSITTVDVQASAIVAGARTSIRPRCTA